MVKNYGKVLREMISKDGFVYAHGVSNAASAKSVALAGIKVIYAGGYAAAANYGWPDMGIISLPEMVNHMQRVSEAVDLPVMGDADDGYGGIHQTIRAVGDYFTKTNLAGLHLEDQKYPKRCGHIAGKKVLPLEEFLGKLKAAIDVRNSVNPSGVIMARTDAFSAVGGKHDEKIGGDINEAIRRGREFAETGADIVWCEFPNPSVVSAEAFARGMEDHAPSLGLGFNVSPSFSKKGEGWLDMPDAVTYRDLIGLKYKFIFSTYPSLLAAMFAENKTALMFKNDPVDGLRRLQAGLGAAPTASAMEVMNVKNYQQIEAKYSKNARKKLEESKDGFKG